MKPEPFKPSLPRCAHCNGVIPKDWRERRIGRATVCWDCKDVYPVARVLQLEAVLRDISLSTDGRRSAKRARLALITKTKDYTP